MRIQNSKFELVNHKRIMKRVIALLALVAVCSCAPKDYKDATLPVEERVEALLSQMTLEEKVGQMSQ